MIHVVAATQVKPQSRDALVKGAGECVATTRKEQGCIARGLP
jgi:quinol monooxygenase YgiN